MLIVYNLNDFFLKKKVDIFWSDFNYCTKVYENKTPFSFFMKIDGIIRK
jgi:hypothetical protein